MTLRLGAAACALALCWAGAAQAHAFWIEPKAFWLARPGEVAANLMVGGESARDRWGLGAAGVVRVAALGPGGERDLRAALKSPDAEVDARVRLAAPGLHLIALESRPATQTLPAERFNAYAEEEGLSLVLADRAGRGAQGQPGREVYSRRAKALVQVGRAGPEAAALATQRLGHTLEIVPERDPFALGGEPLPVRLYYEGRPLAGATIELINLDIPGARLARKVTDADGRVALNVPPVGAWLLNAIWSKPVDRPEADFETTFASLTFGYPQKSRTRKRPAPIRRAGQSYSTWR